LSDSSVGQALSALSDIWTATAVGDAEPWVRRRTLHGRRTLGWTPNPDSMAGWRRLGGVLVTWRGWTAASLLVAGVILLIPAAVEFPSSLPSAKALVSIAVLGIVCTAIAMLLMFYLVRHAGASRASVITYINPVVATLLGVMVLDEHLGLGGFIAFALILLGSWLATRGAVTRSSPSEATVIA